MEDPRVKRVTVCKEAEFQSFDKSYELRLNLNISVIFFAEVRLRQLCLLNESVVLSG